MNQISTSKALIRPFFNSTVDFTQLWGKAVRKIQGAGVLNGISVSEDPDALYITGKNWKKMFLVK